MAEIGLSARDRSGLGHVTVGARDLKQKRDGGSRDFKEAEGGGSA